MACCPKWSIQKRYICGMLNNRQLDVTNRGETDIQVVSWLDPGALGPTGAGSTAEDRAAGGTEAGESGYAHVLAESDLKPLAAKVSYTVKGEFF